MEKRSTVKSIQSNGDFVFNEKQFYKYEIQMENGDVGEYNSLSANLSRARTWIIFTTLAIPGFQRLNRFIILTQAQAGTVILRTYRKPQRATIRKTKATETIYN